MHDIMYLRKIPSRDALRDEGSVTTGRRLLVNESYVYSRGIYIMNTYVVISDVSCFAGLAFFFFILECNRLVSPLK